MITNKNIPRYTFSKAIPDSGMDELKGEFCDASFFDVVIRESCDGYDDQGNLLFCFRKGVISNDLCDLGFDCFEKLSRKKNMNRGMSAGVLDINKMTKDVKEVILTDKFRGKYINQKGKFVDYNIGNVVHSNIIGYYEKSNNFNNKKNHKTHNDQVCNMTAYTKKHPEILEKSHPLVKRVDQLFSELVPDKWTVQKDRADKTPEFVIRDTSFSTITVNNNFRTAVHKDKGDFEDGFGNIIVLSKNSENYDGCYLGLPQFKVAIDVRKGDHLCFDVHQWHCNTEFVEKNSDEKYTRLSLVFYLRKNMYNVYLRNQKIKMSDNIITNDNTNITTITINSQNQNNDYNYTRHKVLSCEIDSQKIQKANFNEILRTIDPENTTRSSHSANDCMRKIISVITQSQNPRCIKITMINQKKNDPFTLIITNEKD